jgi:hypothetical protein
MRRMPRWSGSENILTPCSRAPLSGGCMNKTIYERKTKDNFKLNNDGWRGRDGKDHKLYKTTHCYDELYNLRGYKEKQLWELKHPESRTMLSIY